MLLFNLYWIYKCQMKLRDFVKIRTFENLETTYFNKKMSQSKEFK